MARRPVGMSVFAAAVQRMADLYREGHRMVVSFSGGKDSCVTLECCILAAKQEGCLPVEAIMRDEEIQFPGTFEYCLRTAARPEVRFNWVYANQPVINVFDREHPYWWVFDPLLPPEKWVRRPPDIAYRIEDKNIERMTIPSRFPPPEGKTLFQVIGLRVSESRGRMYGLFSSGGYLTKANREGTRSARPVYDWTDGDVWKAIHDEKWDYNEAYDVMARMGIQRTHLRIAPPTMNRAGIEGLMMAMKAWPRWFDLVCDRLPGVRAAAKYGLKAVSPHRHLSETWEMCYRRTCIAEAPTWIALRATRVMDIMLSTHRHHSNDPFPDILPCYTCSGNIGSWKSLCLAIFNGDPFSNKATMLPYVEPEEFREGAGTWGGTPGW